MKKFIFFGKNICGHELQIARLDVRFDYSRRFPFLRIKVYWLDKDWNMR